MYVRTEKEYNGLQVTKINVGQFLGEENPEDAYVVLKDPSIEHSLEIRAANESGKLEDITKVFFRALPDLIVGHNLYETKDELMTNEAVAELITSVSQMALHVMQSFTKSLFSSPPSKTEEK